ncbi:MAG TPA: hypothetical protein GXX77_00575 [Candidatus Cloacimonetes bacterium]|nr:hypothetical protein [Candidatus Cloacimonadota bacterium]
MIVLIAILIFLLAYLYGCFSTARVIAKTFRSLNVYKVGTGLPDTENIYMNISKSMGILVGMLDATKAYFFLWLVELVLRLVDVNLPYFDMSKLYSKNLLLFYGSGMLVGHCLPATNKLRGGRGILTYMGFTFFFIPLPTFVTAIIALILAAKFKQSRFAQYLIVILPAFLHQVLYYLVPNIRNSLPSYFGTILMGSAVFMGVLNVLVSKKLGEI